MGIVCVEQREDRARVRDDHGTAARAKRRRTPRQRRPRERRRGEAVPNPSSSASARSDRSPRPLRNAPTLRGICAVAWRATYSATASRTSAAGATLRCSAIRFNLRYSAESRYKVVLSIYVYHIWYHDPRVSGDVVAGTRTV